MADQSMVMQCCALVLPGGVINPDSLRSSQAVLRMGWWQAPNIIKGGGWSKYGTSPVARPPPTPRTDFFPFNKNVKARLTLMPNVHGLEANDLEV